MPRTRSPLPYFRIFMLRRAAAASAYGAFTTDLRHARDCRGFAQRQGISCAALASAAITTLPMAHAYSA